MSTDTPVTNESTDRQGGQRPGYTYHREPARQGGATYVRCEACGREAVPAKPDRVYHRDDCPGASSV